MSNYSLTIQALLNGTGVTSFDAELKVPEPRFCFSSAPACSGSPRSEEKVK